MSLIPTRHRRENFLSEPWGSGKKRDGTSSICAYGEGKKNHYYTVVLVCTAKEKKTYSHRAAFVYAAKEKKNY